jgi:hypothetical protein
MAYVFGVQPIQESFGFEMKAFVKPMQNFLNFEFLEKFSSHMLNFLYQISVATACNFQRKAQK